MGVALGCLVAVEPFHPHLHHQIPEEGEYACVLTKKKKNKNLLISMENRLQVSKEGQFA